VPRIHGKMKIRHHFLITGAICLFIYPQVGLLNVLVAMAFGVLVDVDHYLYYIIKFKSFDIKKSMNYFSNIKDASHILLPFHWVEWCVVLLVLSLYFEIATYALLGYTIHISLDYLQMKFRKKKDGRNLSLLGWWVKKG